MNYEKICNCYSNNICKVTKIEKTPDGFKLLFSKQPEYKITVFENDTAHIIYLSYYDITMSIAKQFDGYCLIQDLLPITHADHKCYEYNYGESILYDLLPVNLF